jgi:hypothetical protein
MACSLGLIIASCNIIPSEDSALGQGEEQESAKVGVITVSKPGDTAEPEPKPELKKEIRDVGFPKGKVFAPEALFGSSARLDKAVMKSNPQLYLFPDFDPDSDPIMVIGMPGWGGRSENFIWVLVNSLKKQGFTKRLVVASIQDTQHGGPQYQGQGTKAHANTWIMDRKAVNVMNHFVSNVAGKVGHLKVYFMGYSTGAVSAPLASTRVARLAKKKDDQPTFTVEGAVSMGCDSRVAAASLKKFKQRVLFIVVPEKRARDPKPMRDDQWNRQKAERALKRLVDDGAVAYLRHIQSARRHIDWHWGLISQCRYFRTSRIDPGRGYWPNYWMPNPETAVAVASFIQGQAPPENPSFTPSKCPY